MSYGISAKRRAQWSIVIVAGFLGLVSLVGLGLAIADGATLEFGFVAGCLVFGIGGPIYAYVKYLETSSGQPVIEANETHLKVLGVTTHRSFEWSQVTAITYRPDNGRKTLYVDIAGIGPLRNSRGTQIAVALQQHEVAGRTKDHADALTRLWHSATHIEPIPST